MSIRHYSGEYLVSPAPIHMGLNWCTHACFYCFANLNRPDRRADYSSIKNFLRKVGRREPGADIAAKLAIDGHPILASNDSDPFAKSNGEQNLALMRTLMAAGLRFVFQTRGGDGAIELLREHPPTMLYISFTTDQESTRKRAEPGAPSFEARKALAAEAKALGHHVVAGINPFYAPWWDDIEGFIDWLAQHDIQHAWLGEPHLNYMQVAAMREKTRTEFAQEITWFRAGRMQRGAAWPHLRSLCEQAGINTFVGSTSARGGFWQPYFDLGYPFFPTLDGWFSHLNDARLLEHLRDTDACTPQSPIAFTFDAFHEWASAPFGDFRSSAFKEYLTGIGRSIRNTGADQKANTLREVHEFLWRIDEFPTRLRHDDLFIGTQDGNLAVDDQERLVLVHAPGETDPGKGRVDIDLCPVALGLEEDGGTHEQETP